CHTPTVAFASTKMNHTGITTGCATCHNGTTAVGKSATHIPTTASCETCHTPTVTSANNKTNHNALTTRSSTCHLANTTHTPPARCRPRPNAAPRPTTNPPPLPHPPPLPTPAPHRRFPPPPQR